jgi:hypothetical protein
MESTGQGLSDAAQHQPVLEANRSANGKIAGRRPQKCLGSENHDQGDS